MLVPTTCGRVCHENWVPALAALLTMGDSLDGTSREFCIYIHTIEFSHLKKQTRKKSWQ